MFFRETAQLHLGFGLARSRLAEVSHSRALLLASQEAYREDADEVARVGPPATWPGLSKLVTVHVGDLAPGTTVRLPLRWEASGPGSALFPVLDADIILAPEGEDDTVLTLIGVYRPPLGPVGAMLDRLVLSRIATATIRDFVGRLARTVENPADGATQPDGGTPPDGATPSVGGMCPPAG